MFVSILANSSLVYHKLKVILFGFHLNTNGLIQVSVFICRQGQLIKAVCSLECTEWDPPLHSLGQFRISSLEQICYPLCTRVRIPLLLIQIRLKQNIVCLKKQRKKKPTLEGQLLSWEIGNSYLKNSIRFGWGISMLCHMKS